MMLFVRQDVPAWKPRWARDCCVLCRFHQLLSHRLFSHQIDLLVRSRRLFCWLRKTDRAKAGGWTYSVLLYPCGPCWCSFFFPSSPSHRLCYALNRQDGLGAQWRRPYGSDLDLPHDSGDVHCLTHYNHRCRRPASILSREAAEDAVL